jgi:large subunit ribosomal protein L5
VSPKDDKDAAKADKADKAARAAKSENPERAEKAAKAKAEKGERAVEAEKAGRAKAAASAAKAEAAATAKPKAPKETEAERKPARIKLSYVKEVVPRLMKEREYPNVMAVPRLKKVVVNMGVGEATQNIKLLDAAMDELGRITGQRPAMRRSRKSIAAFKLRAGMPIAATVTLRGDRMYEFVDRLFNVALPRVRDFRGVPTNAFDGRGNYTLGLKDQIIFPEVDYAKVDKLRGMNVTFVTSARTDEESQLLLKYLGMPFKSGQQEGR